MVVVSDSAGALSEFEYGLIVAANAFNRWIVRAKGGRSQLSGTDAAAMSPGDVFVIETPGGGGYGKEDAE